jgi:2-haloacid dehalogenase
MKGCAKLKINTIIFDAYGTLFDVHSIVEKCEQFFPGKGRQISECWRQKQLEYTWLRSLMGSYEDFWSVTSDALTFSFNDLNLDADEEIHTTLLNQYLHLTPYPEVPKSLENLKGKNLAILSNGSPKMLHTLVDNTNLSHIFTEIISVHDLKIYKPNQDVYQLGVSKLGINKEETLFITSNPWDAAGAKTFGFQVCWINRFHKQFDELGVQPDLIIENLAELKGKV